MKENANEKLKKWINFADSNSDNPLKKKQELKEEYQKRKPEKVKTAEEMGLVFEKSTLDYFRNLDLEYYKEESEWLIKIREDLSDIEFPLGVLEYSVACPEGIYQMVIELKKMYLELKMGNIKNNPFYKMPDKELLKKFNITEHLKSETPDIPIEKAIIKFKDK